MINSLTDKYNGKFTGYTVETQPIGTVVEPIALHEAKMYARVDGTLEDDLILALIKTSRVRLEKEFGKCFIPQTITIQSFNFPYSFQLPFGPLLLDTDVTKVVTIDLEGNETNLDYIVNTGLFPKINIINASQNHKFKMIYKAGFNPVPEDIKLALKMMVNTMYERREDFSDLSAIPNPFGIREILDPYKTYNWFGA